MPSKRHIQTDRDQPANDNWGTQKGEGGGFVYVKEGGGGNIGVCVRKEGEVFFKKKSTNQYKKKKDREQ